MVMVNRNIFRINLSHISEDSNSKNKFAIKEGTKNKKRG